MDDQWVEQLVRSNRSALLGYIHRHVANREDAEDLLNQMIIFANGVAAFAITDPDSFSRETVSRLLSRVCIGIVIADKLRDSTMDLPAAKAMAEAGAGGVTPRKKADAQRIP